MLSREERLSMCHEEPDTHEQEMDTVQCVQKGGKGPAPAGCDGSG